MSTQRRPRVFVAASTSPTSAEDATEGYRNGDVWVRTGTGRVWLLADQSTGSWVEAGAGGGSVGPDLSAIEALTGTGFSARTAADTWALRTITGPAAGLTVTHGAGVAGDPTLALANDLAALEGLAGTGWAKRTGVDTWTLATPTAADVGADPTGTASAVVAAHVAAGDPHTGYQLESEKGNANGYAGLDSSGYVPPAQLGSGSGGATKFLREDSSWQTVSAGTSDHAALSNRSWTLSGHTGTASRIAGFDGSNVASLYAIGTDLQAWSAALDALAALATTGLVARTGAGTFAARTLTATANQTTVTDGDGVAGNPVVGLASDVVLPGTGGARVPNGTTAQRPTASTGVLRWNSSLAQLEVADGASWVALGASSGLVEADVQARIAFGGF